MCRPSSSCLVCRPLSLSLSLTHTHTHTRTHLISLSFTHTHTHTYTRAHTHTHTQTHGLKNLIFCTCFCKGIKCLRCSVLQCVAVCCSVLRRFCATIFFFAQQIDRILWYPVLNLIIHTAGNTHTHTSTHTHTHTFTGFCGTQS